LGLRSGARGEAPACSSGPQAHARELLLGVDQRRHELRAVAEGAGQHQRLVHRFCSVFDIIWNRPESTAPSETMSTSFCGSMPARLPTAKASSVAVQIACPMKAAHASRRRAVESGWLVEQSR
ncbi:MAG: hypothetical protein ABI281_00085, partial [Caldimonas sp.]